jgi:hypothetical protein
MTEEYYNIEKILARRKIGNKFEYKIKWEGYPLSQSTWEPLKNLENAHHLIEEFDKTHPKDVDSDTPKIKENLNSNKKRKTEETIKEIKENEEELNNQKEIIDEKSDENSKILIYENENSYKVDSKFKRVLTVKNQKEKLIAIVEQLGEKGELFKSYIPTEELRKINPWILLQFYESKIKFT